jgi:hypothetical protein
MATWTERDGDIAIEFPGMQEWTQYTDRAGFDAGQSWIIRHDDAEEALAVADHRSKRPSSDLCVLPSAAAHFVLEVKDASNPRAKPKEQRRFIEALLDAQEDEKGAFARKRLIPGYLIAADYISWLTSTPAPYPFYILLETPVRLDAAQLGTLISDMQRALKGPRPHDWKLRAMAVLDVIDWNKMFPQYPALRLSAQGGQA